MSSKDSFIFVHIPKTAGTSIHGLLQEAFGEEQISPAFPVQEIDQQRIKELEQYRVISGHISFEQTRKFAGRKLLTVIRDPVDRCLSLYSYFRELALDPLIPLDQITDTKNCDREAISLAKQLDPEDFFMRDHPHIVQNLQNRMVWQLGFHAAYNYRPKIVEKDVFRRAMKNIGYFEFVGIFENLTKDIDRLRSSLGLRDPLTLSSRNRTRMRLERSELGEKTLGRLRSITALDQKLYDHVCGRGF